jgi:hypothetical protein
MITRRGKKLRGLAIGFAVAFVLWGLWEVSANLWATSSGWCWGSATECLDL